MEHRCVELLDQINRLKRDPLRNQHELHKLRIEYNGVVGGIRDDTLAPENDIFNIFPPEIWTQIVKHALPSRGYSSALLLLTAVSRNWKHRLISASTLWACIELRGSQEDSLATIKTFMQLSGEVLLHLYIYVPTRYDARAIRSILESIRPRLHEVTVRVDAGSHPSNQQYHSVFRLLLIHTSFRSRLAHIHLEAGIGSPLYSSAAAQVISGVLLPPTLRSISGWEFMWSEFYISREYLNHVEAIESYAPITQVMSKEAPLPMLKNLKIYRRINSRLKYGGAFDPEGLPQLNNLTSLTYKCAFREGFMQFLSSVAPQLFYLELRLPFVKLPNFSATLQAANSLRKLSLQVDNSELDELNSGANDSTNIPLVTARISSLRDPTLHVLQGDEWSVPNKTASLRDQMLCALVKAFSTLYWEVEIMELNMDSRYPESIIRILDYIPLLPKLRSLIWPATWGYFRFTEQRIRELKALEYLDTGGMFLLGCTHAPELLWLRSAWGLHAVIERLKHENVRKLFLTYESDATIEFPDNSFPCLQELTMRFEPTPDPGAYGSFKLESFEFPFLSSITLMASKYVPHETMLCFALIYQPEQCPALTEIKFRGWPPDWDSLFLMLEKRNFLANRAIAKISRFVLPFIPGELRGPLALLLGGRYTERPSNEDLLMGGAQESIIDETIAGCLMCLLCMRGDCTEPVTRPLKGSIRHAISYVMKVRFGWNPDFRYADPTVSKWTIQRMASLRQFTSQFEIWARKNLRETQCARKGDEMEMTEYGVDADFATDAFEAWKPAEKDLRNS